MSYRSAQIAVESKTVHRLYLVTKLHPRKIDTAAWTERLESVDGLADRGLNEWIKATYPDVIELEKKLAAVEAEAIKQANGALRISEGAK